MKTTIAPGAFVQRPEACLPTQANATSPTVFSQPGGVEQKTHAVNETGLAQRRVLNTGGNGHTINSVHDEDQLLSVKLEKRYLNQPQNIHLLQVNGVFFLHYASERGLIKCVKYLLTVCRRNQLFGLVTDGGSNLVHLAAARGHTPILEYAIERFGAKILLQKDNQGFIAHHFAAHSGQVSCLDYLLGKYTAGLYCVDSEDNNPVHWAASNGHLEVLKLVADRVDSIIFAAKGKRGLSALHFAAQGGYLACVDFLLSLDVFHDYPGELTNSAALSDNVAVMERLINHYGAQTLLDPGTSGVVSLCIAAIHECTNMVKYLLEQDTIQKNLNRIDLFSDLLNLHNQCTPLLACAYRKMTAPVITWPSFTTAALRPNRGSEWPLMATKPATRVTTPREWPDDHVGEPWSPFIDLAKSVLAYLGSAAIYLYNPVYDRDSKDCFFSMGDLVAGSLMATTLETLGAKSLEIILSPPKCRQAHVQRSDPTVAPHKLAAVWPQFDPGTPLPQTISTGSCQITFRAFDDHCAPLPKVIFSFVDINLLRQQNMELAENFVCLKPYRFSSHCCHVITNIRNNRGYFLPLSLPANSVIPESFSDKRSPATTASERVAQYLIRQSHDNAIDLSVVYGLHHTRLESSRTQILHRWTNSITLLAGQNMRKKPAIIAIASRFNPVRLAEQWHLTIIDCDADNTSTLLDELNALPPGQVALCNLTSLPKAHFDQLVRSSNLPTLVEGANLTSFLLQAGHPYLSVLPSGNTPIPQDMGDPLEAMKLEAFSYKLAIDDEESQFLATLKEMVMQGACEQALKKIDSFNPGGNLIFLLHSIAQPRLTVRRLLAKGEDLGHVGKEALLAAIDPTPEALMRYILSTMNGESPTSHHFRLKQRHVNLPHLNAVTHALVALGKYKADINL